MTAPRDYRDLDVWKRSIDLAEMVYRASAGFPPDERFGLTSQVRRAATSIAANIAEGAERNATGEFVQFLGIASGPLAETETLLTLAVRLGMLSAADAAPIYEEASHIGRMLSGLKRSLRARQH